MYKPYYDIESPENDPLSAFAINDPTNGGRKDFGGQLANQSNEKKINEGFIRGEEVSRIEHLNQENYENKFTASQGSTGASSISSPPQSSSTSSPTATNNLYTNTQINTNKVSFADKISTRDLKFKTGDIKGQVEESKIAGSYAGVSLDYGIAYSDFMGGLQGLDPSLYKQVQDIQEQMNAKGVDFRNDPQFQEMIGSLKETTAPDFKRAYDLSVSNHTSFYPNNLMMNKIVKGSNELMNIKNADGPTIYAGAIESNRINVENLYALGIRDPSMLEKDTSKQKSIYGKTELLNNSSFMTWVDGYFKGSENTHVASVARDSFSGDRELNPKDKELISILKDELDEAGVLDMYDKYKYDKNLEKIIPKYLRDLVESTQLLYRTRSDDVLDDLANSSSIYSIFGTNKGAESLTSGSNSSSIQMGTANIFQY